MSVTTTEAPAGPATGSAADPVTRKVGGGLLDPKMLWRSAPDALKKLDPRVQLRNPVMFVVEAGAALTTYTAITKPSIFNWTIVVWLWLTVVFANLAEAVAEGRGKAQADTLRKTKRETVARRLLNWRPGQPDAGRRSRCPAPSSPSATTWWSRRARSSPATATWSRVSRRWTSRPSPASPPR